MKILQTFGIVSLLSLSVFAHATKGGGSVSSGGEWILDSNNPWFIKNTLTVRYCVQAAPEQMSVANTDILQLIDSSLNYWKKEFASVDPSMNIAQQTFIYVGECTQAVELEFRLGSNSLTKEQLEYFKSNDESLERYIGINVRTSYDRKNLKGQGFIYIAGDLNSTAIQGLNKIPKNIWSHQGLLKRLLIHELGHVFGMPHSAIEIMQATYPEAMIRSCMAGNSALCEVNTIPGIYTRNKKAEFCMFKDLALFAFLMPKQVTKNASQCFSIDFDLETQEIGLFNNSTPITVGKLRQVRRARSGRLEFPVKLYLTTEQIVFPFTKSEGWLNGPGLESTEYSFTFQSNPTEHKNAPVKALLIKSSASNIEAYGFDNKTGILGRLK